MNKISFLVVFSILVIVGASSTSVFATNHLTVSNIGSSGNDGTASNIGSSGVDGVSPNAVPPWIKTSMQFWVDGHTTDAEFLNAVEFLATEKIITVAKPTSTGTFDTEMVSMGAQAGSGDTGTFQTEILSMDLSSHDSFFDIFYESYTVDSFFDIFTEMQHTTDSFFDVFFEVETPRTNECLRGQELVFDERTSSWQCASANTVDSFFDVFFDVATESSQNSEDVDKLEKKIAVLEEKIASIEREMKESGEKGGTEDINIGVGELQR
jgi:hypothetical protein